MTSIGTSASPLLHGSLVLRRVEKTSFPCFHPLRSLPRCPSGFLEPEFHGRVSQRRCNVSAASTSTSAGSSNSFCSQSNDAFGELRFGLSWSRGGSRHGIRVCRATENGGGEKGGGKSTLEPEKEPDSSDSSSTPPPVCAHLVFSVNFISGVLDLGLPMYFACDQGVLCNLCCLNPVRELLA